MSGGDVRYNSMGLPTTRGLAPSQTSLQAGSKRGYPPGLGAGYSGNRGTGVRQNLGPQLGRSQGNPQYSGPRSFGSNAVQQQQRFPLKSGQPRMSGYPFQNQQIVQGNQYQYANPGSQAMFHGIQNQPLLQGNQAMFQQQQYHQMAQGNQNQAMFQDNQNQFYGNQQYADVTTFQENLQVHQNPCAQVPQNPRSVKLNRTLAGAAAQASPVVVGEGGDLLDSHQVLRTCKQR